MTCAEVGIAQRTGEAELESIEQVDTTFTLTAKRASAERAIDSAFTEFAAIREKKNTRHAIDSAPHERLRPSTAATVVKASRADQVPSTVAATEVAVAEAMPLQ